MVELRATDPPWLPPTFPAGWPGRVAAKRTRPPLIVTLVAIIVLVTEANFRSRSFADNSLDWQVLLRASTWYGAGVIGALLLIRRELRLGTTEALAGTFFLFCAASTAWSPAPLFTGASTSALLSLLVFAVAIRERVTEDDVVVGLMIGLTAIVLVSVAISPFRTSIANLDVGSSGENTQRLRGLAEHPVALATDAALLFGLALVRMKRRGLGLVTSGIALLSLVAIVLSQSRSPVAAACLAGFMLAIRMNAALRRLSPLVLVLFFAGLSLLVAAFTGNLLPEEVLTMASRSGNMNEVVTMTGRLLIWQYVLDYIADAPVIGYGYATGRFVFAHFADWQLVHAHNMFLQCALFVGLAGCGLLALTLYRQFVAMLRRPLAGRDFVFLFALATGMTEVSLLGNFPGAVTVAWILLLPFYRREIPSTWAQMPPVSRRLRSRPILVREGFDVESHE